MLIALRKLLVNLNAEKVKCFDFAVGKLKVLPEQPELPVLDVVKDNIRRIAGLRTRRDGIGTPGDSDEGDIDSDEDSEEPEGVEVHGFVHIPRLAKDLRLGLQSNFSHSRWHSSPRRSSLNEEKG